LESWKGKPPRAKSRGGPRAREAAEKKRQMWERSSSYYSLDRTGKKVASLCKKNGVSLHLFTGLWGVKKSVKRDGGGVDP